MAQFLQNFHCDQFLKSYPATVTTVTVITRNTIDTRSATFADALHTPPFI